MWILRVETYKNKSVCKKKSEFHGVEEKREREDLYKLFCKKRHK